MSTVQDTFLIWAEHTLRDKIFNLLSASDLAMEYVEWIMDDEELEEVEQCIPLVHV